MAPAKGSRNINKTIIKGYEDQYDDPPSSSKAKQKVSLLTWKLHEDL